MNKKVFIERIRQIVESPEDIRYKCPGNEELSEGTPAESGSCELCSELFGFSNLFCCPCTIFGKNKALRKAKQIIIDFEEDVNER